MWHNVFNDAVAPDAHALKLERYTFSSGVAAWFRSTIGGITSESEISSVLQAALNTHPLEEHPNITVSELKRSLSSLATIFQDIRKEWESLTTIYLQINTNTANPQVYPTWSKPIILTAPMPKDLILHGPRGLRNLKLRMGRCPQTWGGKGWDCALLTPNALFSNS